MYQAPIFSILWAGRTTLQSDWHLNTLSEYMFCTLKSSRFHPLAVWLFTRNTIFIRGTRLTASENNTLSTENSCWMVHQAAWPGRASDLFWGDHFREHQNNWMGTSLWLPGSFLPLSVCGNCGGEFKDRHSLLGTGMWTLHITEAPLYLPFSAAAWSCCHGIQIAT